jgi:type IV pilus assembly protein PilE
MRAQKRVRGFSLIELMVAVAVIAILARIAYPYYLDQMRKGRRATTQAFIMDVANREQQYLMDVRGYAVGAGAVATLNMTVPTDVTPYYTITIDPPAATVPPSFTINATPVAGSTQANDGILTVDNLGGKSRGGVAGW